VQFYWGTSFVVGEAERYRPWRLNRYDKELIGRSRRLTSLPVADIKLYLEAFKEAGCV
jgi:hypothetical protein